MAEPLPRNINDSAVKPDLIARQTFDLERRGFDQQQVRAYLISVADALRDAQDRERDMRQRMGKAIRRAEQAEQAGREARPADESELTRQLGDEVTVVLDAARAAADQRISAAEHSVQQLLTNARGEADAVRAAADSVMEERQAEARAAADELMADVRAQADKIRERAEADAMDTRTDAADALAKAQDRGDALIIEAEEARAQILEDMDRRRREARAQVERLRVGRDRLLRSYEVVYRTLGEATTELKQSLGEAKVKGDSAARRVASEATATREQLEHELADAKLVGVVQIDPDVTERVNDIESPAPTAPAVPHVEMRGRSKAVPTADSRPGPKPGPAKSTPPAKPASAKPASAKPASAETGPAKPASAKPGSAETGSATPTPDADGGATASTAPGPRRPTVGRGQRPDSGGGVGQPSLDVGQGETSPARVVHRPPAVAPQIKPDMATEAVGAVLVAESAVETAADPHVEDAVDTTEAEVAAPAEVVAGEHGVPLVALDAELAAEPTVEEPDLAETATESSVVVPEPVDVEVLEDETALAAAADAVVAEAENLIFVSAADLASPDTVESLADEDLDVVELEDEIEEVTPLTPLAEVTQDDYVDVELVDPAPINQVPINEVPINEVPINEVPVEADEPSVGVATEVAAKDAPAEAGLFAALRAERSDGSDADSSDAAKPASKAARVEKTKVKKKSTPSKAPSQKAAGKKAASKKAASKKTGKGKAAKAKKKAAPKEAASKKAAGNKTGSNKTGSDKTGSNKTGKGKAAKAKQKAEPSKAEPKPESSQTPAPASPEELADLIRQRDAIVAEGASQIERRLKRVLADEQNELLSALRSARKNAKVELLSLVGDGDAHLASYIESIAEAGAAVHGAGAALVSDDPDAPRGDGQLPAGAVEQQLDELVLTPIRTRLHELDGPDVGGTDERVDAVRAFYRQRKTEILPAAAEALASLLVTAGAIEARPELDLDGWAKPKLG